MRAQSRSNVAYFGPFQLDLKAGELHNDGRSVRLQEQTFQVLQMLLEHPGEVVTRDEMRRTLWPNDTIVEFDQSINAAIKKLRLALRDSAEAPRYVETVARRGYRLMVPVEWEAAQQLNAEAAKVENAALPQNAAAGNLIGKKLSHYRVLQVLGGGGMGVVYKAEDLKLGRPVALKFLPEELASDARSLGRFEREARAASALDHPNICSVYEFGEHEGQPFLVMPLLEGQTLRDRIAMLPSAPFTTDDLLNLAIQIADGLQAAHEKDIIHRDIKPANIFVTNRSEAKILDFGLAKLTPAEDNQSLPHQELPTGSVDVTLTRTGVALGTAAYMSPEQVRGERLDARTDLFSFGLVLYEMAAGQRAFTGETAPILHAAVLNQVPTPVRQLNPKIPPELETIINKSLEKEREERYQTASEMRACLRAAAAKLGGRTGASHSAPTPHTRWRVVVTGVLALLLVVGAVWFAKRQSSGLPQLKQTQLTNNSFETARGSGSISPDGRSFVYSDAKGMHLKSIASGETRTIAPPVDLRDVQTGWAFASWFPDGTRFLVNAIALGQRAEELSSQGTSVWVFSLTGAPPHKIRDNAFADSVSPEGTTIPFETNKGRFGDRAIWLMGPDGENARKLYETDENSSIAGVVWSPDGKRIAYSRIDASGATLVSRDLKGGPITTLFPPSVANRILDYIWLPDGRLTYSMSEPEAIGVPGCNFWELRLDKNTGEPLGEPLRFTSWSGFCMSVQSATADSKKLAFLKWASHYTTYMADLDAGGTHIASSRHFTLSESWDFPGEWTPDGKAVILVSNRGGHFGIYKQFLNEDDAQPLATPEEGVTNYPRVTPDGKWVLYFVTPIDPTGAVNLSQPASLMRVPIDGGPSQLVFTASSPKSIIFCARPPSDLCVIGELSEDRKQVIVTAFDPLKGRGHELTRFGVDPNDDRWDMDLSSDGTRLAAIRSPAGPIFILSLRGKATEQLQPKGWTDLRSLNWTSDGKGLLVGVNQKGYGTLLRLDLHGRAAVLWEHSENTHAPESPDGRHLWIPNNAVDQNFWMLENF